MATATRHVSVAAGTVSQATAVAHVSVSASVPVVSQATATAHVSVTTPAYPFYKRVGSQMKPIRLGRRVGSTIEWLTPPL